MVVDEAGGAQPPLLSPNPLRTAAVALVKSRLAMAVLLPAALVLLAAIAFAVILFGRWQQRREIARSLSRVLSALFDGQGDCTYSAWSYFMVVRGKRWGPARVRFVNAINDDPQHCQDAYAWHERHGLFGTDEFD